MTITYKSAHIKPGSDADLVRQMIAKQAAQPEGFVVTRHSGRFTQSNVFEACRWLIAKGFICKARRSNSDIRFFSTQAAADAYLKTTPAARSAPVKETARSAFAKTAETVFTPQTKYTRIPTPEPRFSTTDIPFQHFHLRAMPGQPSDQGTP